MTFLNMLLRICFFFGTQVAKFNNPVALNDATIFNLVLRFSMNLSIEFPTPTLNSLNNTL